MENLKTTILKFYKDEHGVGTALIALLLPVLLVLGSVAYAGAQYLAVSSKVEKAAEAISLAPSNLTQAQLTSLCSAISKQSGTTFSTCVTKSGTLNSDGTFCAQADITSASCPSQPNTGTDTQTKICAQIMSSSWTGSLGNFCSTVVTRNNNISVVNSGVSGSDAVVPIAINQCLFDNGGTWNGGKGYTFWNEDGKAPYSQYTSIHIPLGWGRGDNTNGYNESHKSFSQGGSDGNYSDGYDKNNGSYYYCSNTANWIDLNQTASSWANAAASTQSAFFNYLTLPNTVTKSTNNGVSYSVLIKTSSGNQPIAGPQLLTNGKAISIGQWVPALGGIAANTTWYSLFTAGSTYLFPVVSSYKDSNSIGWNTQSAQKITAFAPMMVNKVCLGSLGSTTINSNGSDGSGCSYYGKSTYTVPSSGDSKGLNGLGQGTQQKIWLPYLDVTFVTGYKPKNAEHRRINGDDGHKYGGEAHETRVYEKNGRE